MKGIGQIYKERHVGMGGYVSCVLIDSIEAQFKFLRCEFILRLHDITMYL